VSFAQVLREVIEEDDGLVLHLSAYERWIAASDEPGGKTAGAWAAIRERSRKIAAVAGAFLALARRRSGSECL
jgi:hypothetical protein